MHGAFNSVLVLSLSMLYRSTSIYNAWRNRKYSLLRFVHRPPCVAPLWSLTWGESTPLETFMELSNNEPEDASIQWLQCTYGF